MEKPIIDSILNGANDLLREWNSQAWMRAIFVYKFIPNDVPKDEWIEVSYWEPPYHPIVVIQEATMTLIRMDDMFYEKYDAFSTKVAEAIPVLMRWDLWLSK